MPVTNLHRNRVAREKASSAARESEGMKTIARRISKLEERFATRRDERGRSVVDVIRERRRHRLAAEGREPEEELPQEDLDAGDRPRTLAERMRRRFQLR
jgi:hypothetical protein